MNERSRDQILVEAMGGCWHETAETEPYHDGGTIHICKCGAKDTMFEASMSLATRSPWERLRRDLDFSTWEGFGRLWEWAEKQEWWGNFLIQNVQYVSRNVGIKEALGMFIDPSLFADAVHKIVSK